MRVLHVVDRLTDRGGAYWHLLGILAEQRRRGHELLLACGREPGHVSSPCPITIAPGLEARTRQPLNLDPVAQDFRPDVVHLHTVVNPAALEWAAARDAVITIQDHRYFCPMRGKWRLDGRACREVLAPEPCAACFEEEAYFREIYALTAERLSAVRQMRLVVLSHYMKRELVAAGADAARIAVIPPFVHGLDPDAEPAGAPCVLFVGRLAHAKGVLDALEAWRRSGLALPLVFAGTGPLRAQLEGAGALILGWVPHAELSAVYRRARAVLMPSLWQEPFGLVGLEAVSLSVPVAAYRSGGIPEWHPGDGLVEWRDVSALAGALRDCVTRRAAPRASFDRNDLTDRLLAWYTGG
jgi:glycosyltransferase involved in cell wall biosynthesis